MVHDKVFRKHCKPFTLCIQPVLFPKPTFTDNGFHAFEPSRHHWVVACEVKVLWHFIDSKICCSHFQTILVVPPGCMWIFWHLLCWESIWCLSLMAWHVIKQEKASDKSICLCLKNINGIINLLMQVICVKVPISVLPCFEEHLSFTVLKGQSHWCQNSQTMFSLISIF